jgi:hypothetical protein
MIVKKVEQTEVTNDDLNQYLNKISKLDGIHFTGLDVGMNKRIVTIRFGGEYEELTMINPRFEEKSEEMVTYVERDSKKLNKTRRTLRHRTIKVNTDNLGLVEFTSDKSEWESSNDFFMDAGLFECVLAQRLIDSIDGIDVTHKDRLYSIQIKSEKKPGRNERVMLQSPEGEMEFVKYKNAGPYLERGYQLV